MRILMRSKLYYWVYILPAGVILIFGCLNKSYFEMICAICAVLFWAEQLRLLFVADKDEKVQRKQCKYTGFLLLIPAIGMIAAGIFILATPYRGMPTEMTYCATVLSALLSLCLLCQIIIHWKTSSLAARFLRLTIAASLSVPLSLIITLILYTSQTDETSAMSCMSTVILGCGAFLIVVNMMVVSLCGYKSTRESMKTISDLIMSKKLVFARATILKDALLVAGKSIISIISLSFFMFANALYSTGMGIARVIAVRMYTQNREEQIKSYRHVGIIIFAASICYVLYSVRLFFGGKTGVYPMNIAIMIAMYTFIEFGINVKEALRLRKSKALEAKALGAISFSSTLLCFVLTQTAIMSFAADGDYSFGNALMGVIVGGLAALVGLLVILDSFSHKRLSAL